ncbi:MAG: menaquinone biosynthesis protein [Nitrospinae bacterium]|nr:menaquinone biosynthesis protein [Nitrospinota bacterium]
MKKSSPIRFGCHAFLNSKPISDFLFQHRKDLNLDLRLDHPARLADALRRGELDLAFIPSIEYLNIPGALIVPDISIASNGAVKTVLLVCKKKLEDVRSIALDERSRTSVILLKLILKDKNITSCFFYLMPPNINAMLENNDAGLIIGDAAFAAHGRGMEIYDLSSEWFRMTQMPFVHAIIAASQGFRVNSELTHGLREAKRTAKIRACEIAGEESKKLGVSFEECLDYLQNKIIYDLGPRELEGLKKFYAMAAESGQAPAELPELRFA